MKNYAKWLHFKISKPFIVCLLVCMVFLGVASGAAFVLKTVQSYSGACGTLAGVPGILQAALFMPKGDCKFGDDDDPDADPPGSNHKCPPSACSTDGRKGKCELDDSKPPVLCRRHHKPICVCHKEKESRGHGHDGDN